MPDQSFQPADWGQQLAGLFFLAGYAALAKPSKLAGEAPVPMQDKLSPEVSKGDAEGTKLGRQGNLSPEVREFASLPSHIQRQVLDYAKRWINANFERSDDADKAGKSNP